MPAMIHVALHDPAAVLADVESKRRIIAQHEELDREAAGYKYGEPDDIAAERITLYRAMKVLALPFASHPDYREEWKP